MFASSQEFARVRVKLGGWNQKAALISMAVNMIIDVLLNEAKGLFWSKMKLSTDVVEVLDGVE